MIQRDPHKIIIKKKILRRIKKQRNFQKEVKNPIINYKINKWTYTVYTDIYTVYIRNAVVAQYITKYTHILYVYEFMHITLWIIYTFITVTF